MLPNLILSFAGLILLILSSLPFILIAYIFPELNRPDLLPITSDRKKYIILGKYTVVLNFQTVL